MSQASDVFQGQVYFIETMNLFHTIDYQAQAELDDLVIIERLSNVEILIEPYYGQPYVGVVRMLETYQRAPGGYLSIATSR